MKQYKCSMSKKIESLGKKQESISGKNLMDPEQFEKEIREMIDGEYEKILKGCDDEERRYYEMALEIWDDCGYDYAGELYEKLQQQMYEYVSGTDYKMFGNFANIQWDWDDDHKDGIKFADLRKKLLDGVKDADTDEFSTWAIDWFFHAFGTYNMCYNFADDLGEEVAILEQEDEEERERENSDESKKNEKDARMSQPWGDNDLVATEDELARMDKEDPESAYLMRAMQYLRKDLQYVYDLNEEKHLIDRLLNLYDNGVDYKTAVRRIINNDNKLTNRLRLTPAESCKRSEKRTVQPPSYDVYTYDELSDEAKKSEGIGDFLDAQIDYNMFMRMCKTAAYLEEDEDYWDALWDFYSEVGSIGDALVFFDNLFQYTAWKDVDETYDELDESDQDGSKSKEECIEAVLDSDGEICGSLVRKYGDHYLWVY